MSSAPRRRLLLPVVLIVLISLAVYVGSLSGGFTYDDHHAIVQNPHLREASNIPAFFHRPDMFSVDPNNAMYRPLLLTTFAWDHHWHGLNATWGWHLTSLFLHVLTAVVLFGVLRRLSEKGAGEFGWPFWGALLFAVHPIHSETVNYLSARSSLLATLCTLTAFYAYLRARSGGAPAVRRGWLVASAGAFVAGLLAKEIAIVFPAILLVYEGLLHGAAVRRAPRAAATRYVPFVFLGVLYLAWRKVVLGTATVAVDLGGQGDPFSGGGRGFLPNLFTQAEVFFLYLRLLVWPAGLSVDHAVPIVEHMTDPLAWTALVAIATAVGALIFWRHRRPLFVFGMIWFGVALAPTSLIPLNVVANEHRLYLPTVGLLIAAIGLSARSDFGVRRRFELLPRPAATVLGSLVVAVLGVQTMRRTEDWRNELRLWERAVATDAGSFRAQLNFGNTLAQRGDFDAALEHYEAALAIHPRYEPARLNVAESLLRLAEESGQPAGLDQAEAHLRHVIRRRPHDRLIPLKLARILQQRYELGASPDDAERERELLMAALAAAPQDVATLRSVAEHFEAHRDWSSAARYFQALRRLRPEATVFAYRAADLWIRAGEPELAIACLTRLVADQPFEAYAHRQLAELYLSLETPRPDLAARHTRFADQLLAAPNR